MDQEPSGRPLSGIQDLDEILGGFLVGDNVVWVTDQRKLFAQVEKLMLDALPGSVKAIHVTATDSEAEVRSRIGAGPVVVNAHPGAPMSDPNVLEQFLVNEARSDAAIVIDGLAPFARQWGLERAVGFFKRVCPRLFDLGALAYWRVSREKLGATAVDEIRKVTQCVFELSDTRLRIVKAEGHSPLHQGRLFRVSTDGEAVNLHAEKALGRIAEGLRNIRSERTLSQADLARIADVSGSAISQAERGHRGLSLDTLLTLTSRLGVGLDALLGNQERPDYLLARRGRGTDVGESRFLLDDPNSGLRVYLVNLEPGERGDPPVKHKGAESLLVAKGLVLVDLGDASPAMRAGDAVLATRVPILSWRNLSPESSILFWILRD